MQSSPRRAFTLIELLVVIAIIALLAAILFPVFSRARENARKTSCLNNLKQVAIGLQQYMSDFDGYMMGSEGSGGSGFVVSWPSQVFPYVKSAQVFACPSAERSVFTPNPRFVNPANGGRSRYCGLVVNDGSSAAQRKVESISYGRNLIQAGNWTTAGFNTGNAKYGFNISSATGDPTHESDVADPAGTIHIFDAMTGTTSTTADPCTQGNSIRSISVENSTDHFDNSEASKVAPRHFDGFNAMFGDGHVKWLTYKTTKAAQWSVQKD